MDLKTPSSGEQSRNCLDNISHLRPGDEVKFVIGTWEDYAWTRDMIERFDLAERCTVLVSPVHDTLDAQRLAEWVLADGLPVRFQLQLHKFIWSPQARGV
jgi:7-carboxy-7-deazaguanine synthase